MPLRQVQKGETRQGSDGVHALFPTGDRVGRDPEGYRELELR